MIELISCLFSRVDELYKFLNAWVPHLYGELDEEAIRQRGFELIQHDTEWETKGSPSKVSLSVNIVCTKKLCLKKHYLTFLGWTRR